MNKRNDQPNNSQNLSQIPTMDFSLFLKFKFLQLYQTLRFSFLDTSFIHIPDDIWSVLL